MSGIYFIRDDQTLVEMVEAPYDSEAVLQNLLVKYPSLLAGDQINPSAPRRWLLVRREPPVPGEMDGSALGFADHLFLDLDAVPTIVEVKRSTDTRIRREVVGQMLDYAANAVTYWPVETLRSWFDTTCAAQGVEQEEMLAQLIEEETDGETFWQRVKTNLQAGRIRLMFVADVIPPSLRRIVEFLNGQMDPAEVIAVEVRQFTGENQRALVPRVIGMTETAQTKKVSGASAGGQISEDAFFSELQERQGENAVAAVQTVAAWAEGAMPRKAFHRRSPGATFWPCLDVTKEGQSRGYWPVAFRTDGTVQVGLRWLPEPFDTPGARAELIRRLNGVAGVALPAEKPNGTPTFPLGALTDAQARTDFLGVLAWFVQCVMRGEVSTQTSS